MRWITLVVMVLLLQAVPAPAQPADDDAAGAERQPPPVGGLFGLFGRKAKPTPSPREEIEREAPTIAPPPTVRAGPTAAPTVVRKRSPKAAEATAVPAPTATRAPTVAPEPTAEPTARPTPSPTATREHKKGAKPEPTATPTMTSTPEEGAEEPEEERPPEETPEPEPTEEERGEAVPLPKEPVTGSAETPVKEKADKAGTSRVGPSGGKSDVELPSVEIQGELEKPDIFFVLPRARDQSDEQLMRARIRREITRPVIKDWIEEEMLLK